MGLFNFFNKKKKEEDYSKVKLELKRLFEIQPNYITFGGTLGVSDDVSLYPENIFEKVQFGYRVDENGYKNKEWLGEQYYIVGGYGFLGDVLVVDVNDKNLPIYALQHDDWSKFEKIANSVEDFSKIINLINNTDIQKDDCENLKKEISKIIRSDFWEVQIDCAKN